MTDKQIKIDELKNEIACKENIINHLAEHNIKLQVQFKEKEQECEYWKHQAELGLDTTDNLVKELEEKEQECETLASQLDFEVQKKECLEQECEKLKKELQKNFEEKDTLHLIIDRLLEASGYDTNTASAEDFEDVYEHMRYEQQQLDQLKAENDNLKSLIWWIHVGAEGADKATTEYYENKNTQYEENYWKRIRALQPPTYESKYKLALTEIKEIAERVKVYDPLAKQILQKISECEVMDE